MFIISTKNFSVYNRMHAPQTFYCHEQKAYKHKVLFPMSEGLIALVKFSLSYKPNHPTIHSESSENISVPLRLHSPPFLLSPPPMMAVWEP